MSINEILHQKCHEMLHPDLLSVADLSDCAALLSWKAFSSISIKAPMSLLVFSRQCVSHAMVAFPSRSFRLCHSLSIPLFVCSGELYCILNCRICSNLKPSSNPTSMNSYEMQSATASRSSG